MKNKLNENTIENYNSEKITRYAIRKVSFGATSVAVAACFMYLGQGSAAAADNNIQNQENKISSTDENINSDIENTVERTSNETVVKSTVVALDKTKLSSLIAEIESKIVSGAYDSKTEDSVAKLRVELGTVKTILENAKTQEELTRAYNKLITATTQLKTKPEEKKEAPVVDTTNGKATVGIKATNIEKTKESKSIANSGSRDERNGKALNTNNPFRADAATTNDDPSANQTYTAPAENATLAELIQKLKDLAEHIENNDKIKDIDSIGATKNVEAGTVKEIDEFGGWTAVDGGKFAIARKTAEGVYPLETINSTLDDTVWLQEQAFDRRTEYTLLLSKSITRANRNEASWDGSVYKPTGAAGGVTKNVAGYKGIEKTFTAYSTLDGSDVVVKFKPGYVGDSDGSKANYKVQVYSITGGQETLVYETTFDPSKNANDDKKIVTKATDGKNKAKIKISNTPNSTTIDGGVDHTKRVDFIGKTEAEKLMAKPENLPNGESGTFTSKLIALPKGADHYKVRISLADQNRTGMSYQAWDEKYSVPVTGLDFS
ncbi:YSIRK-type signal peptide-containing protein, partial [Gemella sp.]